MPGDRSQIEEIKSRLSIEDIVKRYVKLKPVGKNLFGLCPFHKEDSPSFSINTELNIYKCFGCGETGDIFAFIQKVENLDFADTLAMLAKEAGVTLKKGNPQVQQAVDTAKKIHETATLFYSHILNKHHSGEEGRKYIETRKLKPEVVRDFRIGYAPMIPNGRPLSDYLIKKGYSEKQIIDYGLAKKTGRYLRDRFQGRLMFPVFNKAGIVIGFSGRAVVDTEKRPKYLNSPETPIFHKGECLFGIYQAKQAIRTEDLAILVEGQIDALASWQINIKNVVAPLGTGTTSRQLALVASFTKNIAIAFDADSAGQSAAYRLAILCYEAGLNTYIIEIPFGKDTDECIKKDPKAWPKAVNHKTPAVTYFLRKFSEKQDTGTLDGQKVVLKELIPLLRSISDPVTRDFHMKEVANFLNVSMQVLASQLIDKTEQIQQKIVSRGTTTNKISHKEKMEEKSKIEPETYLFSILLQNPFAVSWAAGNLQTENFEDAEIRELTENLLKESTKTGFSLREFIDKLEEDKKKICT